MNGGELAVDPTAAGRHQQRYSVTGGKITVRYRQNGRQELAYT